MSLYNRLRIIDLESARYGRDVETTKRELSHLYAGIGASYAGYTVDSSIGLCHQWILTDTSEEAVACVLFLGKTRRLRLYREQPETGNPLLYSIDSIVAQIAKALLPMIAAEIGSDQKSYDAALAWQGVKVLAGMAKA